MFSFALFCVWFAQKIQFRNFPFDLEVVHECLKISNCVDHNKLWKILKVLGIPDHLICLLRNRYAGQEATIGTGHGTMELFKIGKGIHQGCKLSPAYSTYMQNTSNEILGWITHKLESRWPGEYQQPQICR